MPEPSIFESQHQPEQRPMHNCIHLCVNAVDEAAGKHGAIRQADEIAAPAIRPCDANHIANDLTPLQT